MWTEEQKKAIYTHNTNILVSAGAGSGKTTVLVERIMEYLAKGHSLREFLVLTFTHAAAEEMKERLFNKLIKSGKTQEANQLFISDITTFDAFCLKLVQKYSYLLKLKKDVKVTDNFIILNEKKKFLDDYFLSLYTEENKEFFDFLDFFSLKDDKRLIKDLIEVSDSLDLRLDKREFLNNYLTYFYSEEFISSSLSSFKTLIKDKVSRVLLILSELKGGITNKQEAFDLYYNKLLTNDKSEIYESFAFFLKLDKRMVLEEYRTLIDELRSELKDYEEYFVNKTYDEDAFNYLKTKPYQEFLIKVLISLDNHIEKFKSDNEFFNFTDIEMLAIKLVEENEDIRNYLKNLTQVMVDEFQDTSDLQAYFLKLIQNNNLYLVGDIKQSIYRFRNANPYIFKSYFDKYLNNNGGLLLTLSNNFRSRKEVLSNFNDLFSTIMTEEVGDADFKKLHCMNFGFIPYEDTKANFNYSFTDLRYEISDNYKYFKSSEIEAFIIANKIKTLTEPILFNKDNTLRKPNYSDFAIIIDRKADFLTYKRIFEYLGIPLAIEADQDLKKSLLSLTLLSLLKIIKYLHESYPKDNEYKLASISLARSFLLNINDEEIYNVLNNNLDFPFISDFFSIIKNNKGDLLTIFNSLLDYLDIYNKLVTVGDVNNHLREIIEFKKFIKTYTSLNFTLLDTINLICDLFDSDLDLQYKESKTSSNQVKIMTTHRSKGLEFPICFFPALTNSFLFSEFKKPFFYANDFGIYFKQDINTHSFLFPLIKSKFKKEEISERMRLFYVALTRTKEKFYLVSRNDTTNTLNKYLSFLNLYTSSYELVNLDDLNPTKKYYVSSSLKPVTGNKQLTYDSFNKKNELISNKTASDKVGEVLTEELRHSLEKGIYYHKLLEYLDFFKPDFDKFNVLPQDTKVINNLLNNEFFKSLKDFTLYKEHEFYYEDGLNKYIGVIDLLCVKDDNIYIVDYKLYNTKKVEYEKQLSIYASYIYNIYKIRPRLFLVSIINNIVTEVYL